MGHVRYIFENGVEVQIPFDDMDDGGSDRLVAGEWTYPFSNKRGKSQAYGLIESFMQSDRGSCFMDCGKCIKVIVTTPKIALLKEISSLAHQLSEERNIYKQYDIVCHMKELSSLLKDSG